MAANTQSYTNLEVGQKNKETTINSNFALVPRYLGEFTSNPATTNVPFGSTYFNSTAGNVRILLTTGVWQAI